MRRRLQTCLVFSRPASKQPQRDLSLELGWPSWVPDWRLTTLHHPLIEVPAFRSGPSKTRKGHDVFVPQDHRTNRVHGFKVATVRVVQTGLASVDSHADHEYLKFEESFFEKIR